MSEHEGKWGGSVPKIPDAPYEDIFGGNNPEHDKRFAEENMPDPARTGVESRRLTKTTENWCMIHGRYRIDCGCPNAPVYEASQPATEPPVQPWMKAAAADLYDYFVMGGGHSGDDTAIAIIAAHAPVPAVRDADVEELVKAAEDFEEVVNRNWECTEWDNLRAALARVKGTKEEPHV
jgi:hypothetical protein